MRIRKLLMSVMVLCFCSFMTVQAEGEQDEFLPEFNIETETVVETSIDSISDISINFTKGSIYRYTGVAVTPEVSSITYVDENGESKELTVIILKSAKQTYGLQLTDTQGRSVLKKHFQLCLQEYGHLMQML